MDLIGRAEEAHHIADIVDAQVHQRAAGAGRVKGRPDLAGAEIMIPAGILAEITLHHRDGAYLGQQLTDLGVVVLFLSPNVLNYLVEHFSIAPVTTPEADLKEILG